MKCNRPNCKGAIESDGFCDTCGLPPLGAAPLAMPTRAATAATTMGTKATSRGTRGTSRSGAGTRGTSGSSKRRKSLGGGLVSLPPQPKQDPLNLLMANPEVPENKRYCPSCNSKVSKVTGFCPQCRAQYNFAPTLKAGDIVNDKYEIRGAIAFGGLGWIYLGFDKILSRWVIMKGLLNAKDDAASAAMVAERQFLAGVKHPKIVQIYDFVQRGKEGYIIMEYVGGKTVTNIRKERGGVLPVDEAISYILGILPAFGYLHDQGMVYCDFKPDNFMVEDGDVKLIDMGGCRKIDDPDGDLYGTKGYMAPEATTDPIEVSDLYTIGRALATLTMDFEFAKKYEHSLPTPAEQPILAKYPSLYSFLLRATHNDVDQRFQDADEMAGQLYGVLREVVATNGGTHVADEGKVFTYDGLLDSEDVLGSCSANVKYLPNIKVDTDDVAATDLTAVSTISNQLQRIAAIDKIATKYGERSVEARLALADALMNLGDLEKTELLLDKLYQEDIFDWRVSWFKGKLFMLKGDMLEAERAFKKVAFEMPGELAPKLALAFVNEIAGNTSEAINYYNTVSLVDPNNTTACFGLARLIKKNDIELATKALDRVPSTHSLYVRSRIVLADTLVHDVNRLTDTMLATASDIIEALTVDNKTVSLLIAKVLTNAITLVTSKKVAINKPVLGCAANPTALKLGAEKAYRKLAKLAETAEEKESFVTSANNIRPVTVF